MTESKVEYCACWNQYGESYLITADNPEKLQVKVFGRFYAPARNSVFFFTREKVES